MITPFSGEEQIVGNNFGYLGRPLCRDLDQADAVVMGVPYDLSSSGRSGARFGPEAIRRLSSNLRWEAPRWPWDFVLADRLRIIDYGDVGFLPGDHAAMVDAVSSAAATIVGAGKSLLTFGGDHFVSLPLIRGVCEVYGAVSLIHFDAHSDTWESDSVEYNHGSMFRQAVQENLIDPQSSVQVGVRTQHDAEALGFNVLDAITVDELGVGGTIDAIRKIVGNRPTYLTFDIDCLDPAFAPATGTPIVGGISTNFALRIIRGLRGINVCAMDVMEVAPAYDHADITALAAATIGLEMLHLAATRELADN